MIVPPHTDLPFFTSKHVLSEITNTELSAEEDQVMDVALSHKGVLTINYTSKEGLLRSRISFSLTGARAVEAFSDNKESRYFQIRVDGAQVPMLLTPEECVGFMMVVDSLLGKN